MDRRADSAVTGSLFRPSVCCSVLFLQEACQKEEQAQAGGAAARRGMRMREQVMGEPNPNYQHCASHAELQTNVDICILFIGLVLHRR